MCSRVGPDRFLSRRPSVLWLVTRCAVEKWTVGVRLTWYHSGKKYYMQSFSQELISDYSYSRGGGAELFSNYSYSRGRGTELFSNSGYSWGRGTERP